MMAILKSNFKSSSKSFVQSLSIFHQYHVAECFTRLAQSKVGLMADTLQACLKLNGSTYTMEAVVF